MAGKVSVEGDTDNVFGLGPGQPQGIQPVKTNITAIIIANVKMQNCNFLIATILSFVISIFRCKISHDIGACQSPIWVKMWMRTDSAG
jgi:hypothetical protein